MVETRLKTAEEIDPTRLEELNAGEKYSVERVDPMEDPNEAECFLIKLVCGLLLFGSKTKCSVIQYPI